jgi:predicted amidohydrolase YtcJ
VEESRVDRGGLVRLSIFVSRRQRSGNTMADLVLVNGNVQTMDAAGTVAGAVAVRDGRIAAVGGDGQARASGGPAATVVDLGGRWIVPG